MNVKNFVTSAVMFTAGILGLSSCNNENVVNRIEPPVDGQVTVSYEAFIQEADGTLSPYTSNLRAVTGDVDKATVTGDGSYFYNDLVNLKVEAKDPYQIYQLFEKDGKGGFTKATGIVNAKEKTLSFKVIEDMNFIAILSNVSDEEKGYRNLTVDSKSDDFSISLESSKDNYTKDQTKKLLAVGEEVAPIKAGDGTITGWSVINGTFKAWDVTNPTPSVDWLTVNIDKTSGEVSFVAKPFNEKAPARSTKVKIGKNGTSSEMPSDWIEVTINQSSFFADTNEVDNNSEFTYGDGTPADIKALIEAIYNPNGDMKDFKDLDKTLKEPIFVLVPTYKDGKLLPKEEWVKEPVTVDFGNPNEPWLQKDDSKYAADMNDGKTTRTDNVPVNFKVGGKTVATTTVKVTQDAKTLNVDVEIQ